MKCIHPLCLTVLLIAGVSLASERSGISTTISPAGSSHLIVHEVENPRMPAKSDGLDQDSTIFFEDFETEPTNWQTQDLTEIGPQWHPDPFNAYSGNSWWCGDSLWMGYYNLWLQYLITPTLDLAATTNPQLTFQVRWAMESTTNFPPPAPYDGWDGCNLWISMDNGANWEVIRPVSPAYTCDTLSSFTTVWGFPEGIPGWADSSGGWLAAAFDLSGYQTRAVKLRWVLCSDRAVSSQGHPEITGFFLDDILLVDGSDTLLWNDADGAEIPTPLTYDIGPPFGDWWEWTTMDAHSPTHSMRVDDDHFYINNALVSPPIDIPEDYTTRFKYWVRCDFPDSTHPGSTSLRDFYFVEASSDGVAWDTLFYDYARGGAGYPEWAQMVPGLPYNGNLQMDLTGYAGQTIQLRFRAITDGDHLSGNGEGLFIDDVEVYVNPQLANDVGIESFHIPFPTAVNDTIEGSITVRNYGLNDQLSFYAFWRIDGELNFIGSSPIWSLPGESDSTVTVSFYPTETGPVFIDAYTMLTGDMNPANDTSWAGEVDIMPQYWYELGYDARGYSYLDTLLSLHYDEGNGPIVRFIPSEGIGWDGYDSIRVFFWEPGEFTLHIYDEGTATTPGPELGSVPVSIGAGQVYPNWTMVDIRDVPGMVYRIGDFWVWLEMTQSSGGPDLVADDEHFGDGHFFDYDGLTPTDTQYEFYVRAFTSGAVGVEPESPKTLPEIFVMGLPHPNPFNPTTRITFALPAAGLVVLEAYNLAGQKVAEIAAGDYTAGWHEVTWNAEALGSGIYLLRMESPWGVRVRKAVVVK